MFIQYCEALRTIPTSKVLVAKDKVQNECTVCSAAKQIKCERCILKSKILDRYYQSNIPIDFWNKDIESFVGDKQLTNLYDNITKDVKQSFEDGNSFVLKGRHGVGKTFESCNILKRCAEKGYSCLYTTLSDIVSVLVTGPFNIKFEAGRELKVVDWLIIDEFSSRLMANDSSGELFGRILENIIRGRLHNKLPTILISNDLNPEKALGDDLSASISSLIAGYMKEVFVTGSDFRQQVK